MVRLPVLAKARVVFRVDHFDIAAGLQAQPGTLDARSDDGRPADEDRPHQAFIDGDLHRAQHALVFALGVGDALGRLARRGEHRAHEHSRVGHEADQRLAIGLEVGDRPRCDA